MSEQHSPLMPVEQALARLLELADATPIVEQEIVDLAAADGRVLAEPMVCLLYTSPSPRDVEESRMPSSA